VRHSICFQHVEVSRIQKIIITDLDRINAGVAVSAVETDLDPPQTLLGRHLPFGKSANPGTESSPVKLGTDIKQRGLRRHSTHFPSRLILGRDS